MSDLIPIKVAELACKNLEREIARLQAENERLVKVGDAMADEIVACYRAEGFNPADSETLPKWTAAKEGKPSE